MSLAQNKAVHALGGFLLMGSWAAFANRGHAMPAPLIAGVVQGLLTATITLFLKAVIEAIFQRSTSLLRFLLPPLSAFLISLVLLTAIHRIAGTPEVLTTIAVPITVSTLYACLYTIALSRNA